ncbi:hypothetical protein B0T14DRAFT_325546 [Immersiella caudata]|uniref:Uncharacterized protein n=1 Tax=Immersiella caudata TaxID=314043 RepID=A0AA39THG9_9PEZI|nr:hypothetical protein B0T14DRAFT_325546 [Immersiella caudata]
MGGACSKCAALPEAFGFRTGHRDDSAQLDTLRDLRARHHANFAELNKSAEGGCQVCALFRDAILQSEHSMFGDGGEPLIPAELERQQTEAERRRVDPFAVRLEATSCLWGNEAYAPFCQGITSLKLVWRHSMPHPSTFVPQVTVGLSTPTVAQQGTLLPGRAVCLVRINRPPGFELPKSWLEDFVAQHTDYPKPSQSLPLRVLDVGDPSFVNIRLLVTTDDSAVRGHYATLSYC